MAVDWWICSRAYVKYQGSKKLKSQSVFGKWAMTPLCHIKRRWITYKSYKTSFLRFKSCVGALHQFSSHFRLWQFCSLCLLFFLRAPQAMMELVAHQERGFVSDIIWSVLLEILRFCATSYWQLRLHHRHCAWGLTQSELTLELIPLTKIIMSNLFGLNS